jgi:hypothetical protein
VFKTSLLSRICIVMPILINFMVCLAYMCVKDVTIISIHYFDIHV